MDILYLNAKDIEQIALTDAEIIGAIEDSLRAQGNGQTSIEPRVHINPDPAYNGHFNVLRGYIAPYIPNIGRYTPSSRMTATIASTMVMIGSNAESNRWERRSTSLLK